MDFASKKFNDIIYLIKFLILFAYLIHYDSSYMLDSYNNLALINVSTRELRLSNSSVIDTPQSYPVLFNHIHLNYRL